VVKYVFDATTNTYTTIRLGMNFPFNTVDSCWKNTNGRGVGTIPSTCPPGFEMNGLLCYPTCKEGYSGGGPLCWQSDCPSGFRNDPITCFKERTYGRGLGGNKEECRFLRSDRELMSVIARTEPQFSTQLLPLKTTMSKVREPHRAWRM
jgi:hypothetical protein